MVFTVGIAGITGKFARLVAKRLLDKPDVLIRGYCRNPAKLPAFIASSPRVQVVQGEATDRAALRSFASGSDVVVCCYLGDETLMTQGQKLLIDACEEQGVKRYVHLDAKNKIQGVHVLIGTFMDTFWNPWFQIWRPEERTLRYWGTGEEIWESTPYTNAADFVAQDAYNERPQLECLGSLDELHKMMHAKRAEDPQNKAAYIPLFYHYYCTSGQTHLGVDMNTLPYPGLKRVTFDDFLRTHGIGDLAGAAKALA
ncbi:hypothetical protein B0J13DRAFT_585594 [Dactylonectria estremocensis]|uniref:NAD(P)-binding domain-containing protein n=1 Tax=Dactylonectria estremocensis TaxID=1079267 RepID=A0A9P9ENC1_9HYPO|nr:hypothetical protein B0J13DRAFT_585594 [Dactylonectria estremocensis]